MPYNGRKTGASLRFRLQRLTVSDLYMGFGGSLLAIIGGRGSGTMSNVPTARGVAWDVRRASQMRIPSEVSASLS